MEGADAERSAVPSPAGLESVVGDPLLEELFPRLAHGVHWGLGRMEAFLDATGNPQRAYPTIHLGGTNGKGSVASTISAVLNRHGLVTGLYTSPHLCSFRERFRVAGSPVEEDELRELAGSLDTEIARHRLTFFEAATGLAFHLFQRRRVDVAVIEVGLGGRLDATNVLTPLLTAITNIAKDHSEYLGETLPEIAAEKVGIVKKGVPLLTAESDASLLDLLAAACTRAGAPFVKVCSDALELEVMEDHTAFTVSTEAWGPLRVWTPLVGAHQAVNGALAVALLERLPDSLRPDRATVLEGISKVRWPGRTQVEHLGEQTWLFDVAHNTAGARALVSVLERLGLPRPLVLLAAVLGDKDWRSMLPALFDEADRVVLTQTPSAPVERRWDPYVAAEAVGGSSIVEIRVDFEEALAHARALAGPGTVVVTGSNHTVGDALRALGLPPF